MPSIDAGAEGQRDPGGRGSRYKLIRRLAIGGMAEIFLAEARGFAGFHKQLVLKRIRPQFARDEAFVTMFLDEARLAATLDHPNIAQVYDIGRSGGSYFFTMEYVRGRDLRQIMSAASRKGQPIPIPHVCAILLACCDGLHYAHEKVGADGQPMQIVHRDVSPPNVLVTFGGAVKLVDFGVAKARSHQAETVVGTLKGKIAYMAPEQCRAEAVDRRSDTFALGILLFELTTTTRLFSGKSDLVIMQQIVSEEAPAPSSRRPDCPPALDAIAKKALARDPAQRYQTAQELQLALESFVHEQQLAISTPALGRYVQQLFAEELAGEQRAATPASGDDGTPAKADTGPHPRLAAPALPFAAPATLPLAGSRSRRPPACACSR